MILSFLIPQYSQAFSIDLTVSERAGIDRANAPISYGIPLKRSSNITSTESLGLFDGTTEIASQFRVISRYGGTPTDTSKPIRVVLADTQFDLLTSKNITLTLKNTGSGTAFGKLASENSNGITVDTGAAIFSFNKTGNFNLFNSVIVGTSEVVSPHNNNGIELEVDNVVYASYNSQAELVEIEENGPFRAVVKARGFYRDSNSNKLFPPLGDTGLEYECHIVLYKDKSYARVFFTHMSENFGWAVKATHPNHSIDFNWLRIKTTLNTKSDMVASFDGYTSTPYNTGKHLLAQTHSEISQNESDNFSYIIQKGSTVQSTGSRYDSYADLSDNTIGIMVANRWFWQTWPKAVEFDNNDVNFYLWPDEKTDYTFLGGNYKTHEILYFFHENLGSGYNFSQELAQLKSRPIFLASSEHYAYTEFIDFMPPISLKTDYTFPGGEKLQAAYDTWENSIQAKYDGNLATTINNSDFNKIREARPFIWSGGIHDGQYMNWYGWRTFGDMWRYGTYGSAALHYNWDYISLVHGLRFNNHTMLEVGEQMALHHSDFAITHDPTGTDDTGGAYTELWYRGGGRYELDSQMQRGNNMYSFSGSNDPRGGAHTWFKGIILQYMLTGNGVYLNSINQMIDHWTHNFKTNGIAGLDCSQGPCWDSAESRQTHRVIQMMTDIWKLTGDINHLNLVNDIVNNSLLENLEEKIAGQPQGYYHYDSKVSSCCGSTCNAHPFYDGLAIKPLITAYHELKMNGYETTANAIFDHMLRKSKWYRDTIFTNYEIAPCGTYGTGDNSGKYFPYQIRTSWKEDCTWNDTTNDGTGYINYAMFAADAFAFVYELTGDSSWFDLARNTFKDNWLYKSQETFQNINLTNLGNVDGLDATPANAWMKSGNQLEKPMYYLYLEWKMSLQAASHIIKSMKTQ